jgi:CBS domain-containing protein
VIGEGTQHEPGNFLSTIMVGGDLKRMSPKYIRGATMDKYGTTLYVGIGIPIPIINERVAKTTGVKDSEIFTNLLDYGIPSRARPVLKKVSYEELKSGEVELEGNTIRTAPLSSYKVALEIANLLKKQIEKGKFYIGEAVKTLPTDTEFKPMKQTEITLVKQIMNKSVITVSPEQKVKEVAKLISKHNINHLPVLKNDKLVGIVTSWDVSKALATDKEKVSEVMTKKVITATENEAIAVIARRLEQHDISALPVIDKESRVVGIITSEDLVKLVRR